MKLEDHISFFLVLLLAALMLLEWRRYLAANRDGEGTYPRRRIMRRASAFFLLEGALLAFILPRRFELISPGWQLASMGIGLILALLAMIPVLRDWREMRLAMMSEAETFAVQASAVLKQAIERELHERKQEQSQDKAQE